jgi:hypothetical protein
MVYNATVRDIVVACCYIRTCWCPFVSLPLTLIREASNTWTERWTLEITIKLPGSSLRVATIRLYEVGSFASRTPMGVAN